MYEKIEFVIQQFGIEKLYEIEDFKEKDRAKMNLK